MVQYFTAKPQQGITSILVNKTGFLSSVLLLSLVQSFLFDFADIYNLANCSKSPPLFDCSGQVSSNSLCNRRVPSLIGFSWPLLCSVTPWGSYSAVGIACFEKQGTKGRQGHRENLKFGIPAHFVFNWKAKKKKTVCKRSLESLHA